MRWMKVLLPVVAALCLAACPSNCKTACENVQTVCADQFKSQGTEFDVNHCTDSCESNLDGCKNMDEQESCLVDAKLCGDLQRCPGCLQ